MRERGRSDGVPVSIWLRVLHPPGNSYLYRTLCRKSTRDVRALMAPRGPGKAPQDFTKASQRVLKYTSRPKCAHMDHLKVRGKARSEVASPRPIGIKQARSGLQGSEMQWWEYDPEESPVPLVALGCRREPEHQSRLASTPLGAAHRPRAPGPPATLAADGIRSWTWTVRRERLLVMIAIWVAACLAVFALGWRQGSTAGAPGRPPDTVPAVQRYLSGRGVSYVTSGVASYSFTEGLAGIDSGDSKEVVR